MKLNAMNMVLTANFVNLLSSAVAQINKKRFKAKDFEKYIMVKFRI